MTMKKRKRVKSYPYKKGKLQFRWLLVLLILCAAVCLAVAITVKQSPIEPDQIPPYSGSPYVEINNGLPSFRKSDYTAICFSTFSPLDDLGRCGPATACIGKESMPTEPRGAIGQIKPSGWHTIRYDDLIEDKYLYNRCHLIGYQLTGENSNPQNLITGTRYLNIEGMLPFENRVSDYVERTGNHVLYRVTPVFEEKNLLADGVIMEALSMEDKGQGIRFHVYLYNVQPGISIDYTTGESSYAEPSDRSVPVPDQGSKTDLPDNPVTTTVPSVADVTYILNSNTKRFHRPDCPSVNDMKEKNKIYSSESREEILSQGYQPCKSCQP